MTSSSRSGAALAYAVLLLATLPSLATGLTPDESKAVGVLTTRFETVIFSAGRLASETVQPGVFGAVDTVRLAAYEGRLLLDELRPDAARSLAALSTSVLVGAKDFRAPSGPPPNLGDARPTKCFVFTLRPGARYDLAARLASAARVPGTPDIRTWKARQHEGEPEPVSWFAAAAGDGYVVLANDLDELRAAARLLVGSEPGGAPPLVDAPFVRHRVRPGHPAADAGGWVIVGAMAAYVKAVVLSFAAAIAVGAGIGAWGLVGAGKLSPADKATVYAAALAEGMNCAAFFVLMFVPIAVVFVFIRRFRRRRRAGAVQ